LAYCIPILPMLWFCLFFSAFFHSSFFYGLHSATTRAPICVSSIGLPLITYEAPLSTHGAIGPPFRIWHPPITTLFLYFSCLSISTVQIWLFLTFFFLVCHIR
jgi:hypothetical protein